MPNRQRDHRGSAPIPQAKLDGILGDNYARMLAHRVTLRPTKSSINAVRGRAEQFDGVLGGCVAERGGIDRR